MKEFIDKLISRLKAKHVPYLGMDNSIPYGTEMVRLFDAISIVNQLAEEYKHCTLCYLQSPCEYQNENAILSASEFADDNGWIPCSERLPEWGTTSYLVCLKNGGIFLALYLSSGQFKEISSMGIREFCEDNPVVAWQPLPAPYQPKGE